MADRHRKPEAWRRLVEREGLVSAMNATKWRETTEAMRLFPGGAPGFRIKDLGAEHVSAWDCEWYYHPHPWETIEWMEIAPDPRRDEIIATLRHIGAPISI